MSKQNCHTEDDSRIVGIYVRKVYHEQKLYLLKLKRRKKRTGKEKKMERVLEKLKTNDEFEQAIADAVVKQLNKKEREGK